MIRTILAVVLGMLTWIAVVIGLALAVKTARPDINAALVAHTTTAAMAARLAMSFVASLAAGAVAASIGPKNFNAAIVTAFALLGTFVYYHLTIWAQFPLWYHLTFFASLLLLPIIGGRLVRN